MSDDGCVIVQMHAPAWFETAAESESERDGIVFRMRDVSHPGPGLVSATVEYADGDQVWTQAFTARRLDDDGIATVLAAAGLRLDRFLTGDRTWFRALHPRAGRRARYPGGVSRSCAGRNGDSRRGRGSRAPFRCPARPRRWRWRARRACAREPRGTCA